MNSILKLDDDKKNVLAWSSGNHAQAIASACYLTNKNATIVMPEDSPNAKLNGTKSWGADVVTFDRYTESREEIGTNLAKEINAEVLLDNGKALDISQLTSLIKESTFVIANDTGPAHIAAHVGAKGLTLFGKHTTAYKVSIERDNFKAIEVTDLNNLSAEKVFERLSNSLS